MVPAASPAPHAGKRLWRARAEQVRAAVRSLPPLKRLRHLLRVLTDGLPSYESVLAAEARLEAAVVEEDYGVP